MTTVSSPMIVYTNEKSEDLIAHIEKLQEALSVTRLRSYRTLRFWRTPNEEGEWNHKNTGNMLHRATKHMGTYFTCPVFVNYNQALTMKGVMEAVELLRYSDLGRFYLVNLNTDGTYEINLYQNTNTSYKCYEDVELLNPTDKPYTGRRGTANDVIGHHRQSNSLGTSSVHA